MIDSGVRFLSTALPQVIATVLAGGLATGTGVYVSYPNGHLRDLKLI